MRSLKSRIADWLGIRPEARDRYAKQAGKLMGRNASNAVVIASLKRQLVAYERKLRYYERRDYSPEIDPIAHNTAAAMDEFFDSIENEEVYSSFGRALRTILDQHGESAAGKTVLDWGTGPGIVLNEILRGSEPKSVTGYDFSNAALSHARKLLPQGRFEIRDIYEQEPDRFEFVLCTEVLEHLEHPEVALRNLFQATGPGGTLILTVPDGRIDYSRLHINFWSPESWRLFLKKTLPDSTHIVSGTFQPISDRVGRNNFAIIKP